MVLLTSSTVSVIISSGVICVFTFALFLSGYVLQQQSVRNIQHAIRAPDRPSGPLYRDNVKNNNPEIFANTEPQIPNQQPILPPQEERTQDQEQEQDQPATDPIPPSSPPQGNYAYLQLLSSPNPTTICSAILFFQHLATNHTKIQDRLFMYPREWDSIPPTTTSQSPSEAEQITQALTLLRHASLQYGIWLLPIDTTAAAGARLTDTKLLRLGQIQFVPYDSVLYLPSPGLVLDTAKLDSVLLGRPLPGRFEAARLDSVSNPAWVPVPLRPEREERLPSTAYLVTVNNVGNGVPMVEARGHVLNSELEGFGGLVSRVPSSDSDLEREVGLEGQGEGAG
ncbi:uncharacterized protein BO97DRAFT_477710 [Aspergillus homomorphus CBS 101889]|uniref:Uncharacterized protein n=1 Tax=Aspergillus homomorphus (strain CBS 101889) TaxID=1450537 RepID=A0A395HXR0_ASPHC|nr:hypothetical protein BO97DRAFT_477710 [Aspergillus homomorphus CBS 101889]RAL12711.1 hypothetical protein BO97DRAFT_477710 [Aspergillus homomorphus CBS 101889]